MTDILEYIKKTALEFPSIYRVMLFGSRARGDNTPESDYDIALFGADNRAKIYFSDKADDLPTLHKIDIIFINEKYIGKPIYESIMKEGIIIMDKFLHKLENYKKALARLDEGLKISEENYSQMMQDAVIKRFEFTSELAWKTAREYLIEQGETDINSPKPVMRAAFRTNLISDEAGWLNLLEERNKTAHIYDDEEAAEIYDNIKNNHIFLFKQLLSILELKGNQL